MTGMNRYGFELLRYVPNLVSSEFFNIGVLLYDGEGRLLDARFAREFDRLRCHPAADFEYLEALRNEFEEQRLLGEGFSAYSQTLLRYLSRGLQVSEREVFWGGGPVAEIERLYEAYVAPPRRQEGREDEAGPRAGTRRALRQRMEDTFTRYHLFGGARRLMRDHRVSYGGARLQFTFDYSYQPNGVLNCIHGIAQRNDVDDATKLCFVYERLRSRESDVLVTAILDDAILSDTRELLSVTGIRCHDVSRLDEFALGVRGELGL